jgi:uncharacterized protein YgiM (DUF1202 family)
MMDTPVNLLVRVTADYQAPYADPIQVNAGDKVVIDLDKKTDIAGWVWCTNRAGKSGWVPQAYIENEGNTHKMRCDYDAIELTIHVGEILTAHKAESGFYWVTDQKGLQGWVPISHVESFNDEREAG